MYKTKLRNAREKAEMCRAEKRFDEALRWRRVAEIYLHLLQCPYSHSYTRHVERCRSLRD